LRATPVFVDIDPRTYNLDPARLPAAINARTKAVLAVSLYGQCADFDAINHIAARHGVAVIEDGAQSFGATRNGRRSCNLSEIGCTSFFPSKPLGGYGDGGACFTNSAELAEKLKQIRVHGQDRRYHHPLLGINGRLDTLQAAVLLAKLEAFPQEIDARQQVAARYDRLLAGKTATPYVEPNCTSVYAQYTIQVDDRKTVEAALKAKGIPSAVHYPIALHRQPVFDSLGLEEGSFPVSEAAARRVLSLPMHPYLSEKEQQEVADALTEAVCLAR
jgi:UDP-2-acetamido-2-deoxy-ribo-hexuluronate aminotransferase